DAVFFGFWLSHVPPDRFDDFWQTLRRAVKPGGRVAFVDEDERASSHDDVEIVDGAPVAKRTLSDGRTFDIVKIFWRPDELEQRLRSIGWDITVRPLGDTFLSGVGSPS
ncbi:MAG: class I SAM-dependent methyltransferase, partial [Actinomycetota bacterium]